MLYRTCRCMCPFTTTWCQMRLPNSIICHIRQGDDSFASARRRIPNDLSHQSDHILPHRLLTIKCPDTTTLSEQVTVLFVGGSEVNRTALVGRR